MRRAWLELVVRSGSYNEHSTTQGGVGGEVSWLLNE